MSLILRVFNDTTEYTYNASMADDADIELAEGSSAESNEMGDISLTFGPTFLGFSRFIDLPAGPFRAELRFTYEDATIGEQVLINGRIERSAVEHFPEDQTWAVTIRDDSLENFLMKLEAVNLQNVTGVTSITVPTQEVDSDGGWTENNVNWHDAQSMWNQLMLTITETVVLYQNAPFWLTLDVVYDDGGGDQTISRQMPFYIYEGNQPLQVPNITGGQFFDLLHQMLGWRIRAQYLGFPAEIIEVEILTDYFLEPVIPAPSIDGLHTRSGYSFGFEEAQQPDFAINYENSVGDEQLNAGSTPPIQLMLYAGERQELSPQGEPQNESVRNVDASIPDNASDSLTGALTPDPTNHPTYTEILSIGRPVVESSKRIYVGSFYDDGGTNRLVISRNPSQPGTGQLAQVAEYWAVNLLEQFELTRSTLYNSFGGFRLHDIMNGTPFGVGDPLRGLRLDNFHWMIREMNLAVESTETEMQLVRLESTPSVIITLPLICPPGPITVIQTLFNTPDPTFQLEWDAPELGCGQQLPAEYEVSVVTPNAPYPFVVLDTVSTTSYVTNQLIGGGFGTYVFQVRSKTIGGEFSDGRFASIISEEDDDTP